MFAPNFGKLEKKTNPDGTVETVKLSGLKSITHAGVLSELKELIFIFIYCFLKVLVLFMRVVKMLRHI
jgi:hypothetical protein